MNKLSSKTENNKIEIFNQDAIPTKQMSTIVGGAIGTNLTATFDAVGASI